jgi:hypothetical protein
MISRGTPGEWRAKRPKTLETLSYAKAVQEYIRLGIVCDVYPEVQVSKENLTNIQQNFGGLVNRLPKEGFISRLIDMYWTKGVAIAVCLDEETRDGVPGCSPYI